MQRKGLEKEVAEFRAGQEPAETKAKIVPLDYFTDAAWRSPFIRTKVEISFANLFLYTKIIDFYKQLSYNKS